MKIINNILSAARLARAREFMRRPPVVVFATAVILAVAVILIRPALQSTAVMVMPVQRGSITAAVRAAGTINSRRAVKITAPVSGVISGIPERIKTGSLVESGRLLMGITPSPEEKASAIDELKEALINLDLSRKKYDLSCEMFSLKAISSQELLKEKMSLEKEEKNIRKLREKTKSRSFNASFGGVIVKLNVKNGEIVKQDGELFTLVDMNCLVAEVDIPETDIARVKAGQQVNIYGESFSLTLTGSVEDVALAAKEQRDYQGTPMFLATVAIENPNDITLLIGSSIAAEIVIEIKENVLLAPLEAVLYRAGEAGSGGDPSRPDTAAPGTSAYVFVAKRSRAVIRPVTTGIANEQMVEITSGLTDGEQVITFGNLALKNGQRIKLLKDQNVLF